MDYQVTIRYGKKTMRYLSLAVEAPDAPTALRKAADEIPEEVISEVDIVELRKAPDYDKTLHGNEDSSPPREEDGGPDRRTGSAHLTR